MPDHDHTYETLPDGRQVCFECDAPKTTTTKLTPAQKVILLHRLTLSDCLAEVLSSSEIPEGTNNAEFDARVAVRYPILQDKADRLCAHVEKHSVIPDALDEDERNILIDCIEGSTWFANEGWDEPTPLWWSSQHRAADALAEKISGIAGRLVRFP